MPQVLTLKNVKAKARAAYAARKLTAQHPDQRERQCVFESGKYHCAIGAALNKTAMKAVHARENNASSVTCLRDSRIVHTGDDHEAISIIQRAHDDWASASKECGARCDGTIEFRKKFLEAIA